MTFSATMVGEADLASGRLAAAFDRGLDAGILRGAHRLREAVGERIRSNPYRTAVAAALRGEFTREDLAAAVTVYEEAGAVLVGVSGGLAAAVLALWTEGGVIPVTPARRAFLAAHGFTLRGDTSELIVPPTPLFLAAVEASLDDFADDLARGITDAFLREL